MAKAVRDATEESRPTRHFGGPRLSVESLVVAAVAREVLAWLLGEDRFVIRAGTASSKDIMEGPPTFLVVSQSNFYCWLETEATLKKRIGFVDLATDLLAEALSSQGGGLSGIAPVRVRWGNRGQIGTALRAEILVRRTQAAVLTALGGHVKELSAEALRILRGAGIDPASDWERGPDGLPPRSVSGLFALSACVEYPEIWDHVSRTGIGGDGALQSERDAILRHLETQTAGLGVPRGSTRAEPPR